MVGGGIDHRRHRRRGHDQRVDPQAAHRAAPLWTPVLPSGHTTALSSVAIAILLTGAQRPRNFGLRLVASLAAVVVAAGTAIALVARHVHYATDTVAGCCVALATVLAVALALDFVAPRLRFHRSHNGLVS
ncbi:MAG: phosphatase PAP2 family protein [Pseudonocardiaceae bacterium]